MRPKVSRALHRSTVVNIGIVSRIEFVANIGGMRSVVGRARRSRLALHRSVHALATSVNRCNAGAGTVVMALLYLVHTTSSDVLVPSGGFVIAGC
jgi:hypothetical protein